ncbi:MAG: branched-chain amino acid ABC transporter permease [Chloroflexi bacterium]|jgi:branched-chain amino acid transport system permease protein|nr:branched-chain amino acid ABC transporter permease [Chloroflexota bacterium]
MDQFMQAVINGVMLGGFYAAMVLGFSIIWGVMGVINLAHGEFVMAGAYLSWYLHKQYGWEPFLTIIVVVAVMFVVGYLLQRILINRIIERPYLIALLVTFGLSIIIANSFKLMFTATPRTVDTLFSGFWRAGNVTIPVTRSFIMVAALIMMGALYLFLHYTRLGKSIRAAAQNREAARIVGIEISAVYALTFAIAIALTGAAGTLLSPIQPIYPFMGSALTLKAFAITAMAGLGSIPGALVGGLILGLIEVFIATFVPGVGTNLGIVSSYIILVLVLVTRPQGLFGGVVEAREVQ